MTHSITGWNISRRPNYDINIEKFYPYSEVPYIGQYHLVKIPLSEELIDHIDYWGEGRIKAYGLITGFQDCYNVNHPYQLVSNGPDSDRKIPNRIPVLSYTNCDTSSYVKNNSVKLITLMGAPINKSCAQDIARMVNFENGKVIVFGFKAEATDIKNLEKELAKKEIIFSPDHNLDGKLSEITDSYRAYVNLTELSEDLHKSVTENKLDDAISVSKALNEIKKGNLIVYLITRLTEEKQKNLLNFAYKLWNENGRQIIENFFPVAFKLIFNGDLVKIVYHKNNRTLTSNNASNENANQWKIITENENNEIRFKLQNTGNNLFLKLEQQGENKTVTEAENTTDDAVQWYLEPMKIEDDILYFIVNLKNNQGLTFKNQKDSENESQILTTDSITKDRNEEYAWLILPCNSTYEY